MKLIVSSWYFGRMLKEFDVVNNRIDSVRLSSNRFTIYSGDKQKTIDVEGKGDRVFQDQTDRRWDWVMDTLLEVSDQPTVIEVTDKVVNVIFQY